MHRLAIVAGLLSASCVLGGSRTPVGGGGGCESDSDCSNGQVCDVSGACVGSTACNHDGGCDGGATTDSGTVNDSGQPDSGEQDSGVFDAGEPDSGGFDAGQPDSGFFDAGVFDAGQPDSGFFDAGQPDAGVFDGGGFDGGPIPSSGIRVQLTWPQAYGDMDLHYRGPAGTLGETSPKGDLYYPYSLSSACGTAAPVSRATCASGCATGLICDAADTGCTLDWGLDGACTPDSINTDDAVFALDQLFGYGPEIVDHAHPFDGTYTVTAVYYAYDSCTIATGSGNTTAVIDIFVNGALAWSGSMPNMATCDDWDAAQIVVANNGASITVTPLSSPIYQDMSVCGGVL